jgi:hypothetical protein
MGNIVHLVRHGHKVASTIASNYDGDVFVETYESEDGAFKFKRVYASGITALSDFADDLDNGDWLIDIDDPSKMYIKGGAGTEGFLQINTTEV